MPLQKLIANQVILVVKILTATLIVCGITNAHAAIPSLQHLYPVGVRLGESQFIESTGKLDPWPPKVWISGTGVHFEAEEKKNIWKVTVDKKALIGPRLVRFYNEHGASPPRYILVSDTNHGVESEPNDLLNEADDIEHLPYLTHGKLNQRHDSDLFRVHLTKGQTLITRLDAYVLGSTTDAILRLLDSENRILDWNHDHYYLDPFIKFDVPSTGYYWIQIMGFPYPANASEELGGGDGYIYRLYTSTSAYIREQNLSTMGNLSMTGWNLNSFTSYGEKKQIKSNPMELVTDFQRGLITAIEIEPELEPNNHRKNATPLQSNARGVIQSKNDEDWFSFEAKTAQWYQFEIQSARLGYPSDLVLNLYDEAGKELKSDDDTATMNDPRITWKSQKSGRYFLKVSSLTHKGGKDQIYRLIQSMKHPTFELTTDASEYSVQPGGSIEIKVGIKRNYDHINTLIIEPKNLPAGVSCAKVIASKDIKEIILNLHATSSSSEFQGVLNIIGKEKNQWNKKVNAGKPTVTTTVNNGVPSGYLDQVYRKIDQLWLTVQPKPALKKADKE